MGASSSAVGDWVEIYASLSADEANALASRAIALLDSSEEVERQLGVDILRCLANFRQDGLGSGVAVLPEKNLFSPPSLYRNAPDYIAAALQTRIHETNNLIRLDRLLLALAWTRGEPARNAFSRWRLNPPPWAANSMCISKSTLTTPRGR